MIYAPVLIPTLCRSDHFIRCLESLKKNTWAKYTEVYIAVDYPAKESHWDGYKRIVEYLSCDCTEFANLHVIKRPYNYGGAANMVALRDYILKKHDRFIRTDDDCEFSVDFLEYMDCCLEKYEDDDNVIGVTGYSYPVDWNISNNYNAFKNNYVFPMWGTGFWRKKFYTVYEDIVKGCIPEYVSKNRIRKREMTVARYLDSLDGTFNYGKRNLVVQFSDVACGCYMQLFNKYIISPTLSKVRNHGFDGSGIYCDNIGLNSKKRICADNYNYSEQQIDGAKTITLSVAEQFDVESNRKRLNQFDSRKLKTIINSIVRFQIKKVVIKFIGIEKYKTIRKI